MANEFHYGSFAYLELTMPLWLKFCEEIVLIILKRYICESGRAHNLDYKSCNSLREKDLGISLLAKERKRKF